MFNSGALHRSTSDILDHYNVEFLDEAGSNIFYSFVDNRGRSDISLNWHIHPPGQGDSIPAPDLGQRGSNSLSHLQISTKLQQSILDIVSNTFKARLNSDHSTLIKEVEQGLHCRDFCDAFDKQDYRETYVVRWTAARALAYLDLFQRLPQLGPIILTESSPGIVCLGGGAGAEMLALAGYLASANSSISADIQTESRNPAKLVVTAIDIEDWSSVVDMLHLATIADLSVFKPASPVTEASKPSIDSNTFLVKFLQQDVLQIEKSAEMQTILREARLVTIMFTLNGLYSVSKSATTKLLLSITSIVATGSLLLVIDSPGSYITESIGSKGFWGDRKGQPSSKQEKEVPIQWLLDDTLIDEGRIDSVKNPNQWEILYSSASVRFRHPSSLTYPIPLEDTRYQVHLYRRL